MRADGGLVERDFRKGDEEKLADASVWFPSSSQAAVVGQTPRLPCRRRTHRPRGGLLGRQARRKHRARERATVDGVTRRSPLGRRCGQLG